MLSLTPFDHGNYFIDISLTHILELSATWILKWLFRDWKTALFFKFPDIFRLFMTVGILHLIADSPITTKKRLRDTLLSKSSSIQTCGTLSRRYRIRDRQHDSKNSKQLQMHLRWTTNYRRSPVTPLLINNWTHNLLGNGKQSCRIA